MSIFWISCCVIKRGVWGDPPPILGHTRPPGVNRVGLGRGGGNRTIEDLPPPQKKKHHFFGNDHSLYLSSLRELIISKSAAKLEISMLSICEKIRFYQPAPNDAPANADMLIGNGAKLFRWDGTGLLGSKDMRET